MLPLQNSNKKNDLWNTWFFNASSKYVVSECFAEIRGSSMHRWSAWFLNISPKYVVLPLSRWLDSLINNNAKQSANDSSIREIPASDSWNDSSIPATTYSYKSIDQSPLKLKLHMRRANLKFQQAQMIIRQMQYFWKWTQSLYLYRYRLISSYSTAGRCKKTSIWHII